MLELSYSYFFCFQTDLNWYFIIWTLPAMPLVKGFINMFGFDSLCTAATQECYFWLVEPFIVWWILVVPVSPIYLLEPQNIVSWETLSRFCCMKLLKHEAWHPPSEGPRAEGCDWCSRRKGVVLEEERCRFCFAQAPQSLSRKHVFLQEGLNEAGPKAARLGGGTEHSRGCEMEMLGELQNIQVTVTFGGVAEWHSSPFVSCNHLICAFVSVPPSASIICSILMIMSFFSWLSPWNHW